MSEIESPQTWTFAEHLKCLEKSMKLGDEEEGVSSRFFIQ